MTRNEGIRTILGTQSAVLGLLAIPGLILAVRANDGVGTVLGFQFNMAHAVVLLVAATAGATAAGLGRWMGMWLTTQFTAFFWIYAIGVVKVAGPAGSDQLALNTADNFLHLTLAMIGAGVGMVSAGPWLGESPEPDWTGRRRHAPTSGRPTTHSHAH